MFVTDHEVTESDGRLSLMIRLDLGPIDSAELPEIVELSPETRADIERAITREQIEERAEAMGRDAYGLEVVR